MNRIIREHYPVEKLPDDLREGLGQHGEVTVTVEADAPAADRQMPHRLAALSKLLRRGRNVRQVNFGSAEEVDAYVRLLSE